MKKYLFSFLLLIAFNGVVLCQSWTMLPGATKAEATFQSMNVKNDYTFTKVQFTLGAYNLREVSTPQGISYIVEAPHAARIMKTGAPDLPLYAKSVIIPDADNMEITITHSKYVDIPSVQVAPSKGNLLRTVNPEDVAYTYGIEYQQNAFYPTSLAYLREPYILRDFRAQTLVIQPVQYNPVTKTLRIYSEIEIEIKSTFTAGINIFQRTKALTRMNSEFNEIYKRQFINYKNTQKYTPVSDLPGNMLIICYDNFMTAMQPFVNWKIMKGIPTEMVGVSTIGNNVTSLKTYITNYYNTKGLVYLLLVGDFAQVTSPTANIDGTTGAKDNEYAYITGNDHYQEFFVGRFSAESVTDVQTQVDRSIYYEKTLSNGPWLASTLGIGSDQGPGDDNEYDYQHIRGIQTDLMGFTYTTKYELFDGSQGNPDASGDPDASDVSTIVNPGVGSIFYCGHGADTQWGTTGFSTTDATALTNVNKLPFIYSVSCVIGHYNAGTCFCESWMRAKQSSGPAGAIGIFGSTINQSWNPPMQAQDEMCDILVESYTNNIKRTYAGIAVNGMFQMNDESADYDMTDTWTVFGDPSLMVRTKSPMAMTVTHPATITSGTTSVTVNCTADGAYIAITKSNTIYGTAYVSGGVANVTLNPAPTNIGDTLTVCATTFNYTTYIGFIVVAPNNIPVDAQLFSVMEPFQNYYCTNVQVTPRIVIRNQGINNLTSATVNYQIDGGAVVSQNWTGNLATNQQDTVTMPPYTLTAGTHTFHTFITNPNNTTDGYPSNDEQTISYTVNATGITVDFSADQTSSCQSPLSVNFTNLSTNANAYLWDFGDGTTSTSQNPSHTYTSLGSYTVILMGDGGACGNYSENKQNYIQIGSTAPSVQDDSVCTGNDVTLNITGTGTINWYAHQSDTAIVATGNSFTLNNINQDTTLWVENTVTATTQHVGPVYTSGGSTNTAQSWLIFDSYSPFTLISVSVYTTTPGNRLIELKNSSGTTIQSITVNIPTGASRITLNFNVPVGSDWRLVAPANCGLYRLNSGVSYPYTIANLVSIKSSSATSNPTSYYYYFYDWEVKGPDCISARVPVHVTVLSTPNASFTYTSNLLTVNFTNTSSNATSYNWSFGDGTYSTDENPTHIYTTDGDYTVTLVVSNICGSDTIQQTVHVEVLNLDENLLSHIKIYPNPTKDIVNIYLPNEVKTEITFYSIDGKLLIENLCFTGKYTLHLNTWEKGIYLLKVNTDMGSLQKIIMKE